MYTIALFHLPCIKSFHKDHKSIYNAIKYWLQKYTEVLTECLNHAFIIAS